MKLFSSIPYNLLLLAAFTLCLAPTPANAAPDWLAIGDVGNADDPQPQGGFGGVDYDYAISRFETTNADYVAFLNAKASSDPLGLYNPSMGDDTSNPSTAGILRAGTPGSYVYTARAGFESKPVNFVSFFDAMRFANWIHNGEGNGDTETGAYTLLGGTATPSNGSTVQRNPGANVVVPAQDEWFKAAYYDGVAEAYYDFPMGTDDTPTCTSPTADPNTANCGNSIIRGVTPVSSYTGSASPYGTFDQGGNVQEWNENIVFAGGRAVRGGGWTGLTTPLRASGIGSWEPTVERSDIGFRLVLLDVEPSGGSQDVEEISISKVADRFDGELAYTFETCVLGSGILFAEVITPNGGNFGLAEPPFGSASIDDGRCFRDFSSDSTEFNQQYPNGEYVFSIFGDEVLDSKTVAFQDVEPGAYLEILRPSDGATVPANEDLIYEWMLVEKSNGVGCIAGMSCADEISVEITELASMTGATLIVDEELPLTATESVVPASELEVEALYIAEIGTSTGASIPNDTTDMGDPIQTVTSYEERNEVFVEVPELAEGQRLITALLTLAGLLGRRAGRM